MSPSLLKTYRLPLSVSSWLTFAISLTFYWLTVDPGASYWDCAEYITVASKMEVGHPPGNPVWMLVMRAATIPFSPEHHALVINLCSGLFMAFAAFFLSRIIFILIQYLLPHTSSLIPFFISIGASLCFSLCDSAWFSAVEAEVYAMSAFLTSLSLWIMMEWWFENNRAKRIRLLILLAYILGLSLGVHQLNLLMLPVFALVILYKKYPRRVNPLFVTLVLIAAFGLIGLILMGMIPALLFMAESFELFFVNKIGYPYDTGLIVFCILLLLLLIVSLILTDRRGRFPAIIHASLWMVAFIILGFSSFGIILIRAKAAPAMNEGNPDNIFALASYIKREQYPSSPLFYGNTPYSQPLFEEIFINGKPSYSRYILKKENPVYVPALFGAELSPRSGMVSQEDSIENARLIELQKGYLLSDYRFSQMLTPELNMWFPRITSRNINDREAYEGWAGMNEKTMHYIPVSETIDSLGNPRPRVNSMGARGQVYSYKPTYLHNLRFFLSYQAYYMYFRYLFWNFIGRQNDLPSQGEVEHGNFITGIPLIDKFIPGETDNLPPEIGIENNGRNRYFGIPFILGAIGLIWLMCGNRQKRRINSLIALAFFMTGIAIVIYLNQSTGEPRERDYTFLGSYMAFSIWIASGIYAVYFLLFKLISLITRTSSISLIILIPVALLPSSLMAFENFDDHDRSHRFETTFYASSLLNFEYPAIIFSQGDNSTFPLWYASEVLNIGKQHTPVDVTYLSLPSYVVNLKKQGQKGIPTIAPSPSIAYGKFLLTQIPEDKNSEPLPLADALRKLYNQKNQKPVFPTSKILIPTSQGDSAIINLHDFSRGSSYLSFKHLMLLDIIAAQLESDHPKIIFFPNLIDHSFYRPLEKTLLTALFGKIYAPWLTDSAANELMKQSVERELSKLEDHSIKSHYTEPVVAHRSARYRGELILAANHFLSEGDTVIPLKISDFICKYYPYYSPRLQESQNLPKYQNPILPSTFTLADSTFYEGFEYLRLLTALRKETEPMDSLLRLRHDQWMRYYHSLSPADRSTLSNSSKRLLIK